ncbi:glycogen debranching enzyme N-terminal domain-containing protein [candidate division FCPU426 bacterium]|nr:glycogen debranching enzyme N-terminal domain-containing protein [candidate division FCPU426 bacterium]
MIILGRDVCGNLEVSSRKEWLETNGIGGYAQGTVAGMHTRSYHSLLTVSLETPLRRVIMLSQLEETLQYGNKKYSLSTNQYRQAIAPLGYLNIEEFRLDPFPLITYRIADLLLEKQIFMSFGTHLTWITYRLLAPLPAGTQVQLAVRPLVNFRDHHLQKRERRFFNTHHDLERKIIRLLPDKNYPSLNVYHNAMGYEHSALWYHDLFYREEKQRGLECEEDLFSPGIIHFNFIPGNESGFIAATIHTLENPDPDVAATAERIRRRDLKKTIEPGDRFGEVLAEAADQFLVKRGEGLSVIAGYPWLPDSGREAMIALPGLTLVLKRWEEARLLLENFAGYCHEGLLPNYFIESNAKPFYNTVDAALWFFVAVYHYHRLADGAADFIRDKLWETMKQIIDAYRKGTLYGIKMEDDGLITIPEESGQLTWMDAQVGDWIVTPRSGKPIEVNALWYNALCVMRESARLFGTEDDVREYTALADAAKRSFCRAYWNEVDGYCYDRVEDHYQDPSLRPNQILAISLPFPLFEGDRAKKIMEILRQELYTTFGFRTLSRDHEDYKGTYDGDIISREGAAYQGTVWPWLLGPYADALRKVYGNTTQIRSEIRRLIKPFETHIKEVGLGTISEMFDGDPPHSARGCISRAASVSEMLRLHIELQKDPS